MQERDLDPFYSDPYEGDGKIEPGSLEETQLRQAAALAQKVLSRAQELVKVNPFMYCKNRFISTSQLNVYTGWHNYQRN